MEYRYYRELKHNYLVFKNEEEETGDMKYQYKIMESGRIKELVPCAERNINGERYFYYEINSMQSLKDRFEAGKMDHDQLKRLLNDIRQLIDGLSEFLLSQEDIVFNLRCIYTDLSTGQYRFIYCPFFDEKKSFSDFSMELLEIVDENDKAATDLVYKLCEESSLRGDFIYEVIEQLSDGEAEQDQIRKRVATEPLREEVTTLDDFFEDEEKETVPKEKDSRLKRANRRLSGKLQLLFSLMFALLVGAMVYIRMNYILSGEENILSIVVMVVSAITGVIALLGGIKEIRNAQKGAAPSVSDKEADEYEDDFDEDDTFSGAVDKWEDVTERVKSDGRTTMSFVREKEISGETVVLDEETDRELTLFSRNLDKTVRIPLDKLPLTIGKMEGCVDLILSDPSISRMHCRIENSEGRPIIRDLGSTNGTCRNGLKLKPQESVFIEEGDEIRIGRVCFDCR